MTSKFFRCCALSVQKMAIEKKIVKRKKSHRARLISSKKQMKLDKLEHSRKDKLSIWCLRQNKSLRWVS